MTEFLKIVPKGKAVAAINVTDSAVAMTDLDCQMFYLQALAGNTGTVYYGEADVSATTGVGLTPGAISPWIPCANLSEYSLIAATSGDDVIYHAIL